MRRNRSTGAAEWLENEREEYRRLLTQPRQEAAQEGLRRKLAILDKARWEDIPDPCIICVDELCPPEGADFEYAIDWERVVEGQPLPGEWVLAVSINGGFDIASIPLRPLLVLLSERMPGLIRELELTR